MSRLLKNLILICFFAGLVVFLQWNCRFVFHYLEMKHLFLWDNDWIAERMCTLGGFAKVTTLFIQQFFVLPWVGAIATSSILVIVMFLLYGICQRLNKNFYLWPFCFVPSIVLLIDFLGWGYDYCGLVSFCVSIIALWIMTGSIEKSCLCLPVRLGIVMVLFFIVGTESLYVALALSVFDWLSRGKVKDSLLTLLFSLLLGIVAVRMGWLAEYKDILIIGSHSTEATVFVSLHLLAWLSVILTMILFRYAVSTKRVANALMWASGFLVCLILLSVPFSKKNSNRQRELAALSYFTMNERWAELLNYAKSIDLGNVMIHNYVNLALAHDGQLLEHLNDFNEESVMSLSVGADTTQEGQMHLAMLNYFIGNVAGAQDYAFEANQYSANASMLKMLVRTNIIFGAYDIAEKYLNQLEKTYFYKGWAKNERQFLNNEEAVEANINFFQLRRCLPKESSTFIERVDLYANLEMVLKANPDYQPAKDYVIAYLNLTHDGTALLRFVESFYGTKVLPELPMDWQMGLLSMGESLDFCRRHGVTEMAIKMYQQE